MKISILNKKKGFASLEVISMALIGFVVTLSLLSIVLNKKMLLQSEIKTYERKLNDDNKRNEFLNNIIYLINNSYVEEFLKENHIEDGSIDKDTILEESIEDINLEEASEEGIEKDEILDLKRFIYINQLNLKENKFNLYLDEKNNIFVLKETSDEEKNTYYYDYKFNDKGIFLKERGSYGVK